MRIFLKKVVKSAEASGAPSSNLIRCVATTACYFSALSSTFLFNAFYYYR